MVTRYVFRLYLFGLLMLGGFGVLMLRLWKIQIEEYGRYSKELPGQKTLVRRLPGVRGEIRDRNGVPLAFNVMTLEVKLHLDEVEQAWRASHTDKKGQLTAEVPTYEYTTKDETGRRMTRKAPDIFAMFSEETAPWMNELKVKVKGPDGKEREESLWTPINRDAMRSHYLTNKGIVPFTYRHDLPPELMYIAAEQQHLLPGVEVVPRALRRYPFGTMLSHVLGYVQRADDSRPPELAKVWDFYEGDDVGRDGVERSMDATLRGKEGKSVLLKDEHGAIVRSTDQSGMKGREFEVEHLEPVRGSDVYLTIDARIQYIVEKSLREARVEGASHLGRAACVVMDPNNGDVLAMCSFPNYDPNKWVPEIAKEDYKIYLDDDTDPLTNRAMLPYAPGSTFKAVTALAGIFSGISGHYYTCDGGVNYGAKYMKCWCSGKGFTHGSIGLTDALMHSCNAYFYQYGNKAGPKNILEASKFFGLGEPTGIELPREYPGTIPTPQWLALNKPKEAWSDAYTANTSIGQGFVEATPLQMCCVAATVANGGTSYRPRLVRKVHDFSENMDTAFPDRKRGDIEERGFKKSSMELVRRGMWKVVNADRGTGKAARSAPWETAGKTGTAQFWRGKDVKDNHTWFICFAPYDKPRYAVAVFIQGGESGGKVPAPIAAKILREAMKLEDGAESEKLNPPPYLAEVKGHFDHIDLVSFPEQGAVIAAASQPEDNSDDSGDSERREYKAPKRSKEAARPKIRQEADQEGSKVKAPPPEKRGFFDRLFGRGSRPQN